MWFLIEKKRVAGEIEMYVAQRKSRLFYSNGKGRDGEDEIEKWFLALDVFFVMHNFG